MDDLSYWTGHRIDVFVVPIPPSETSPNSRKHFRQVAKAKAQQRQDAAGAALAWRAQIAKNGGRVPPPEECCFVRVHWYKKTKTRMDPDNIIAHLKATFDGLTDGLIFADDRDLQHLPARVHHDKENPRVEVMVYRGPGSLETVIAEFRRDYGQQLPPETPGGANERGGTDAGAAGPDPAQAGSGQISAPPAERLEPGAVRPAPARTATDPGDDCPDSGC